MSYRLLVLCAVLVFCTGCATTSFSVQHHERTETQVSKPAKSLGIPPGHLPPPGQCRIWFPGRPPGHQPRPGRCGRLEGEVPQGAWLLYRPSKARDTVQVSTYDSQSIGVVVSVVIYDAATGKYLRQGAP